MTFFGNRNIGTGQTPESTTVTDLNTEIIPANTQRSSAFLLNTGKEDVWASCDANAVLGMGMLIGKNGGSFLIDGTALTLGKVNGICKAGKTSLVSYQEMNK